MASDKQKIINDIYFDRSGFGSKATTLKDAREKDNTITKADVEEFFWKNVEEKRKPRGENSFVAPHSYWEYQLDLFFISKNDLENQKFRIGMVLIDIFSKYATVIPIKSKEPPDMLAGIMEGLQKMGKKPKMFYSDEEGSLYSKPIIEYLETENIEIHRTRGHPAFAERFIRTYKDMLFKRVEADEKKGKQNLQWIDYNLEILLTYNNKMVSSATGFAPVEVRKPENEFAVKLHLKLQSKRTRMYPEIAVGSEVKVMRKKGVGEKERTSHWLKTIQTVSKIDTKLGQAYYYLDNNNTKGFLRHELLKV